MLSVDNFRRWYERHASVFGFSFPHEQQMLVSWYEFLRVYTFAELSAASTALAQSTAPPRRLADHLPAIHRTIREQRSIAYAQDQAAASQEEDLGTCCTCGGTGWVTVPHLQGVADGQWRPVNVVPGKPHYYTCAVLCSCPLGRYKGERLDRDKRPLALGHYADLNPDWREQLAQRAREQRAERGLEPDPSWSQALGQVLDRAQRNGDTHV